MVRILVEIGLFLLPFALYAVLLLATQGSALPRHWSPRAVGLLCVAAVGLMALGLYLFESGSSAPPGSRYVPAEIRDGVFHPGRFE